MLSWHSLHSSSCGMKQKSKCLSGIQHFMKQWYPIKIFSFFFFFTEEIRYVHDVFTLRNKLWLCAVRWERYQVRCRSTKASKAGRLINRLSWRFPLYFLKQQDLQTVLETSYSVQGRPPHPPLQFFLCQLWGRKLTFSLNTSALHGIQSEGPGSAVLPPVRCSG